MSAELISALFVPSFSLYRTGQGSRQLGDSAVLDGREWLAFSTDSYVVRPRFFGRNVGDLAINGTVNDLAVQRGHWRSR